MCREKTEGMACIWLRRRLLGETVSQWDLLREIVDDVVLNSEPEYSQMEYWHNRRLLCQIYVFAIEGHNDCASQRDLGY